MTCVRVRRIAKRHDKRNIPVIVTCNIMHSTNVQSFNWVSLSFVCNENRKAFRKIIHARMRLTLIKLMIKTAVRT